MNILEITSLCSVAVGGIITFAFCEIYNRKSLYKVYWKREGRRSLNGASILGEVEIFYDSAKDAFYVLFSKKKRFRLKVTSLEKAKREVEAMVKKEIQKNLNGYV